MKQPEVDIFKSGAAHETTQAEGSKACAIATDQQLLREYAATQSESAFAEIVARHAGFVYSAALRQTQNQTTAEEITQAVFVILARKASALRRETVLGGWLFRSVRYAAMDFRKMDARRVRREQEAARVHSTDAGEEPESVWNRMAPLIDEALASLSAKDRQAILLRFFEEKSFREIGETFGGNQNSARLRVVRALEKLRGFFQKRGLALSAGVLSSALLAQSSPAAPPGLVNAVMGLVTSGHGPAAVAVFVRVILRRAWWQRWPLWGGGPLAVFLLAVAIIGLARADRARTATEVRATTLAIDRAISVGDGDAFIAQVRFRTAEEEQFKPVLAGFIRAAVGLRRQVRESFDAQPVRLQIWLWMVGQLFHGQPRRGENNPGPVTDDFFRPYLMVMVKADGAWKWDFFASLPPDVGRLKELQEKTALCERAIRQIQQGEIKTAEQALAVVQRPLP